MFTETNSSWLIYELIKALDIKISIVLNWGFANNTILSCSFLFFFVIDLYFLIPVVTAQIFIPTVELAIPTGTTANEANAEIETQPLTAEIITRKFSSKG